MKRLAFIVLAVCSLVLSGCVSMSRSAMDDQARLKGKPTATIKIYRPSMMGFARTTPIYVNGTYIGRLGSGKTLTYRVKPGQVVIETSKVTARISSSNHTSVRLNARAGKTYNIEVTIPMQIDVLGPITDLVYELRLVSK